MAFQPERRSSACAALSWSAVRSSCRAEATRFARFSLRDHRRALQVLSKKGINLGLRAAGIRGSMIYTHVARRRVDTATGSSTAWASPASGAKACRASGKNHHDTNQRRSPPLSLSLFLYLPGPGFLGAIPPNLKEMPPLTKASLDQSKSGHKSGKKARSQQRDSPQGQGASAP